MFDQKEYMKGWRESNKQKLRNYYKDYRKNSDVCVKASRRWRERHPEKRLWIQARARARSTGLTFNIDVSDIHIPEVCPVFNVPFKIRTPYAPSLDRMDPTRGYEKDNIQVISKRANTMKSNATKEELECFARWVLNG